MKKHTIMSLLIGLALLGCSEENATEPETNIPDMDTTLTIIEPTDKSVLLADAEDPSVIYCEQQGGSVQPDAGITICLSSDGIKTDIWEYYEQGAQENRDKTMETATQTPYAQICEEQGGSVQTSLDGLTALCKTANNKLIALEQVQSNQTPPGVKELPQKLPEPPAVPVDQILESIAQEKQATPETTESEFNFVPLQ